MQELDGLERIAAAMTIVLTDYGGATPQEIGSRPRFPSVHHPYR
jgi:hypothetical protein